MTVRNGHFQCTVYAKDLKIKRDGNCTIYDKFHVHKTVCFAIFLIGIGVFCLHKKDSNNKDSNNDYCVYRYVGDVPIFYFPRKFLEGIRKVSQKVVSLYNSYMTLLCNINVTWGISFVELYMYSFHWTVA